MFEPAGKVTGPPCQRPCVCVPGTWLLGTPQTPIGSKRPGHCDLELSGVVSRCWGPQMEAAGNFSQTHCVPSSASTPSFCVPASLLPPPPSCLGAPAHTCRTSGHPPPSPERWGRRYEPPGQSMWACVGWGAGGRGCEGVWGGCGVSYRALCPFFGGGLTPGTRSRPRVPWSWRPPSSPALSAGQSRAAGRAPHV